MRTALISDIHGNRIALDAVLDDARSVGVDEYWFLGDYCAIGPEPGAVLDRVTNLPGTRFVRGNTDRYVVTGEGPPPRLETVRENPDLIRMYAGMAASFAWTAGHLVALGWLEWLADLPLEIRHTTPEGARLLAVHACPGTDDGEGVHPGRSNDELRALLAGCDADLVFVGHTHEPMVRRVGDVLVVNTGSVSNPRAPDLRASWVLLESSASGIDCEHRRVPYDHAAFAASVQRSRHPAADFILSHQRGERPGFSPHADHTPPPSGRTVRPLGARPRE
ncbi:MAG TPA: metallophosphoesterase family protein [Gemmatimonadaceae bacterium]